jgi:hypothetical protein
MLLSHTSSTSSIALVKENAEFQMVTADGGSLLIHIKLVRPPRLAR